MSKYNISIVPVEYVDQVWGTVEPYLKKALKYAVVKY